MENIQKKIKSIQEEINMLEDNNNWGVNREYLPKDWYNKNIKKLNLLYSELYAYKIRKYKLLGVVDMGEAYFYLWETIQVKLGVLSKPSITDEIFKKIEHKSKFILQQIYKEASGDEKDKLEVWIRILDHKIPELRL